MHLLNLNAPSQPEEWDGDWRLIDWDPYQRISQWQIIETNSDSSLNIRIRTVQHDVDKLLDANTVERNAMAGQRWGDGRKVASVPIPIAEELGLMDAWANKDQAFVNKKLNDGDFKALRTFEGNL